jgi:hypothetical protein
MQSDTSEYINDINRRYKSFKTDILPSFLGKDICSSMKDEESQSLFKYQEFLYKYMKDLNKIPENKLKQRGLLVFHGLGSGKTMTGILLAEAARNYKLSSSDEDYKTKKSYKRKVILIMPASLLFDPWIKELSSKCYKDCKVRDIIEKTLKSMEGKSQKKIKDKIIQVLKNLNYYIIYYNAHSVEGGWMDRIQEIPTRKNSGEQFSNRMSDRINHFDDSVVIIDEIHNLINMFSNKIQKNIRLDDIVLYQQLVKSKNSRIIGLSGTPIVNKPFEIAILANILRGEISEQSHIKFDLNIENFNNLFFNDDMDNIQNSKMLKRRLNGLISYYKGIDKTAFAEKVEDKVLVPFGTQQAKGYSVAQKLENDLRKKGSYSGTFENVNLYRIKASNVVLPTYIFDENLQKQKKLKTLNKKKMPLTIVSSKNNGLDIKIDKDIEKKIIKVLNNDSKPLHIDNELSEISRKTYHIIKKIKESNGPVLVYSRFEGLYGIKFIAEALKQNDFKDYDKNPNKTGDTFMRWTGKQRNNAAKEVFNSFENKNGNLIKVFLMTASGKEGINLLAIRQVHILEPWWNNVIDRQVIARGIRICSHHHVDKKDFIDFRLDQRNILLNTRLVNVFKYYSYIDMRYKIKTSNKNQNQKQINSIKKIIRLDMKDTSIDDIIMTIADNKQTLENLIINILKQVSIDCDINKIRNEEDKLECFIDNEHKNYFSSWNIKDEYLSENINNKLKIIEYNNNKFLVDENNKVYRNTQKNNIINVNSFNGLIEIGTYENNEIKYNEFYKKQQDKLKIKPQKITKKIKSVLKQLEKTIKDNCMDFSVKDIKKSKEYKELPRSAGKSKLKKKELCDVIKSKI